MFVAPPVETPSQIRPKPSEPKAEADVESLGGTTASDVHHKRCISQSMTTPRSVRHSRRKARFQGERNQLVHIQRCRQRGETAGRVIRHGQPPSQAKKIRVLQSNAPSNPRCNASLLAGWPSQPFTACLTRTKGGRTPVSPRPAALPLAACWWECAPPLRRYARASPKLLACLGPRCKGHASATKFLPNEAARCGHANIR